MEPDRRKIDPEHCQGRSIPLPALRSTRRRMALSQRRLAALAGVSANTVRLAESGQRGSYPSTAQKLASALGVDPEALMHERRTGRENPAGE
jgi:transcriptional regulator with XRE-family HTH domain